MSLFTVCISAFVAVFILLSILAFTMRLILAVFPEKMVESNVALIAAISTTYNSIYPGTKITKIEEDK